jgi:hypothetical protein
MKKILLGVAIGAALITSLCLIVLFLAVVTADPASGSQSADPVIEPTVVQSTVTPIPTPTYTDDYVCITKAVADGYENLPVYAVYYLVSDAECEALFALLEPTAEAEGITMSIEASAPHSPVICTVELSSGVEVDVISNSQEFGEAACTGLTSSE